MRSWAAGQAVVFDLISYDCISSKKGWRKDRIDPSSSADLSYEGRERKCIVVIRSSNQGWTLEGK